MNSFLGGPATTDAADKLLADISVRVSRMQSYGQRKAEIPVMSRPTRSAWIESVPS